MKYRRLTQDELEPLKEEFLKYLLVAGIEPNTWQTLKESNKAEAEKHIDVFSDLVFDKILSGINFIDIVQEKRLEVYQFTSTKAYAYIMEIPKEENFVFTKENALELPMDKVKLWQAQKEYTQSREVEMFAVLSRPYAEISSGDTFKQLALLIK